MKKQESKRSRGRQKERVREKGGFKVRVSARVTQGPYVCIVPSKACHSNSLSFFPSPSLPLSLSPYPFYPSTQIPRVQYHCAFRFTRRLRLRKRRFLSSHICVLTVTGLLALLRWLRLRGRRFFSRHNRVLTVIGLLPLEPERSRELLRWGRRCATTHSEHVKNRHHLGANSQNH